MGVLYEIAMRWETVTAEESTVLKDIVRAIVGYDCLLMCRKEWNYSKIVDVYVADKNSRTLRDHLTISETDEWQVAESEYYIDGLQINDTRLQELKTAINAL